MPDVPDDVVAGRIENGKKRKRQFHNSEGGCQMSAVFCDNLNNGLADITRKPFFSARSICLIL